MRETVRPRAGSVRYLLAGRFYRLAFGECRDPGAPVVVCAVAETGHAPALLDPLEIEEVGSFLQG